MTNTIKYETALVTPPAIQENGKPVYMTRVGIDYGSADFHWRMSCFVRVADLDDVAKAIPFIRKHKDDLAALRASGAPVEWLEHAVLMDTKTSSDVLFEYAPKAVEARINYLGSTKYDLEGPIQATLGELTAKSQPPARAMLIDAATVLHKLLHHLTIEHGHAIDNTDPNWMPPLSPVAALYPADFVPTPKPASPALLGTGAPELDR